MGLPWDAYYVLTKAEPSLSNSKVHPNTGAPNYNLTHLLSGLTIDQDLNMATYDIANVTDITMLGNLNLPATSATVGHITVGGDTLLHFYRGNLFIGDPSGNYTHTQRPNVGIGADTLTALTSGFGDIAIGPGCLQRCTKGYSNVGIGQEAMNYLIAGNFNFAAGKGALYSLIDGDHNFAFGRSAQAVREHGDYNISFGAYSMYHGNNGGYNIGIGRNSGRFQSTGSNNVFIGDSAGMGATETHNKSGCVMLGHNAGKDEDTSNKLYIANTDTATPLIYGEFDTPLLHFYTAVKSGDAVNYHETKADGLVELHGTARIYRQIWIQSEGVRAPGTNPATFVDLGISGAWRFADNLTRVVICKLPLTTDIDTGENATVNLGWSSPTTSAVCRWQVEYLVRAANEDMTAAAEATLTQDETSSATANGLVVSGFTIPAAALAATDSCLLLRISRIGGHDNDTLGDNAHLSGLCLHYVSNKLGTGL